MYNKKTVSKKLHISQYEQSLEFEVFFQTVNIYLDAIFRHKHEEMVKREGDKEGNKKMAKHKTRHWRPRMARFKLTLWGNFDEQPPRDAIKHSLHQLLAKL